MMISAVRPPGCWLMSEAVRRSMGILSRVILARTPVQNGARYHTDASIGAFRKAGMVNRNARRQNAYATKSAGRNSWKAVSRGGGLAWGCENRVTCQKPMHTRHQ